MVKARPLGYPASASSCFARAWSGCGGGKRGIVRMAWRHVVMFSRCAFATVRQFQQAAMVHAELHRLADPYVIKRFLRHLHARHRGL